MLTIATRRAAACFSFKFQAARGIHLSSPVLSTFDDTSRNDPPKFIRKHERAKYKFRKPPEKSVCGVGVNDRSSLGNSTDSIHYRTWYNMLYRCYSGKYPTYKDVTVCDEWKTFSNFKTWMMKQEMKCSDISNRQLDKDVLVPGNKVYSPETCHFVTREVNCMFRSNGVDSKKKGERMIEVASQLKEPYD